MSGAESLTHYLRSFLAELDLCMAVCGFKDIATLKEAGVEEVINAGTASELSLDLIDSQPLYRDKTNRKAHRERGRKPGKNHHCQLRQPITEQLD